MSHDFQKTYQLLWDHEHQFAYQVAKKVLQKPEISVWLVLIPILFLYYAHRIQQYKAGVHGFGKGLARTKILALDSALEEIKTGRSDDEYKDAFVAKDSGSSPKAARVLQVQIAEVELLKAHYRMLLREQGSSFQALVKKTYKTGGKYRFFLNELAKAEEDVQNAVIHSYHPGDEAQKVVGKMQDVMRTLREEEVRNIFG